MALIDDLLDLLQKNSLVESVRVINYDVTPENNLELKIRCHLPKGYRLQVWLHFESTFQDYAYQLFTDHPILRWDNAPHYPSVLTAPHHFHDETGQVNESPLSGETLEDLREVLSAIETWLSKLSIKR